MTRIEFKRVLPSVPNYFERATYILTHFSTCEDAMDLARYLHVCALNDSGVSGQNI